MAVFDFSRYVWRQDDRHKLRYKRQPAGGELIEDFWTFYVRGEQNLYIGTYASMASPLHPSDLLNLIRQTWIRLRWDVPTIACQTDHEDNAGGLPTPYMIYDSPQSLSAVQAWAEGTVLFHSGYKDLDALRYVVGKTVMPPGNLLPQTYLHILPTSETTFGVLLQTSHVPVDGNGVKMIMTKFFDILSRFLVDSGAQNLSKEIEDLQWGSGKDAENLLPVAFDILREYEPVETDASGNVIKEELAREEREGPEYEMTLKEVIVDMERHKLLEHPLKSYIDPPYDPATTEPSTRRIEHVFTTEESQKIIDAKKKDSPDHLTVNELIHGALCMVVLLDNPTPTNSSSALWFWGIMDLRRRLKKEWRGPYSYPGYVVAVSSMALPVSLASPFKDDSGRAVQEFARAIRTEYKKQRDYKHLLGIHAKMIEEFVNMGAAMPIPAISLWFAADGKGSDHLRAKYPAEGPTVIEIIDFFTGNNKTGPAPFFRAMEWNGRIKLSVDYNEKAITAEVVETMMKNWAESIMAVVALRT